MSKKVFTCNEGILTLEIGVYLVLLDIILDMCNNVSTNHSVSLFMHNLQLIINTKLQEANEMFELAVTDGKDYITDYIDLELVKHLKEWKKVALLSRVVDSIDTNEKELENIARDGGLLTWDSDDWQSDEYSEVATLLNSLYETRKAIILSLQY